MFEFGSGTLCERLNTCDCLFARIPRCFQSFEMYLRVLFRGHFRPALRLSKSWLGTDEKIGVSHHFVHFKQSDVPPIKLTCFSLPLVCTTVVRVQVYSNSIGLLSLWGRRNLQTTSSSPPMPPQATICIIWIHIFCKAQIIQPIQYPISTMSSTPIMILLACLFCLLAVSTASSNSNSLRTSEEKSVR